MKFEHHYPSAITIEIMDICNLRCRHCFLQFQSNPRPGFMGYNLFEKLIGRISPLIKRASQVNFSSVEALFHPRIFDMIDLVRKQNKNITFRINTNGMLLDENRIDNLLERGIDNFGISLDGCKRETIEFFKSGADFDRVVSNIKKLKGKGGNKVSIEMKFVAHKNNISELMQYIDFCKGLGVEAIHISGLISFSPEIAEYCLYSETGIQEVDELYHQASQKAKSMGIKVRHLGTKLKPKGCRAAQFTMYIDKEGNVAPCVHLSRKIPMVLLNKAGTTEQIIWGNVFEEDPYKIWTGEASTRFRRLLHTGKLPKECELCAVGYRVIC